MGNTGNQKRKRSKLRSFDEQSESMLEYVFSDISLQDISIRRNIALSTISNWSKKYKWVQQREKVQNLLAQQSITLGCKGVSSFKETFKGLAMESAEKAMRSYRDSLDKPGKVVTPYEITALINALTAVDKLGGVSSSEVSELIKSSGGDLASFKQKVLKFKSKENNEEVKSINREVYGD